MTARRKAIKFAFDREGPRTASVVRVPDRHVWQDEAWMSERGRHNALDRPVAIYEVHLGSWRRVPEEGHRFLTYAELAEQLGEYVEHMGFTHVELLPVRSTPSTAPGGTSASATSRPRGATASPRSSWRWWTPCTGGASA